MMRSSSWIFLGVSLLIAPLTATAADYDGSTPLLCASVEAIACRSMSDCERGTAESLNAPQFFRIDFKKKEIRVIRSGEEEDRVTPIRNLEKGEDRLIMQGIEAGRAWNLLIAHASGKMSLSAVDSDQGFVIFGACTPL